MTIIIDPPKRSPEALLQLIHDMAVTSNFAFQPRDGATFCNCYVSVVMAALGCPIAPKLANTQHAMLMSDDGRAAGWMPIDALTAKARAELGYPTLACWANPEHSKPGHIAVCVPGLPGVASIYISQAGAENFERAPIGRGFGILKPDFFTHQ